MAHAMDDGWARVARGMDGGVEDSVQNADNVHIRMHIQAAGVHSLRIDNEERVRKMPAVEVVVRDNDEVVVAVAGARTSNCFDVRTKHVP